MDFLFTPEQDEAAHLAARIVGDKATSERLKPLEQGEDDRFDDELWQDLGAAGLLGLAIPEQHGGAGLGLVELCRVLVEVGRRTAAVPLAVHGPAALVLAEHGTTDQKAAWLPGAATGERLLTAAVAEERAHLPVRPATVASRDASRDDGGWTVTGTKTLVRAGLRADLILLTATTPDGTGVFLVDATAAGVRRRAQRASDGDRTALVELDAAPAEALGTVDGTVATRFGQLLTVCAAAEQLGVTEGALALTSSYAKTREQFGRPIGSFQAVSQRLADGFIDVLCQRLVLWQAAWRLAERLPADTEVAVAKLWAADAGHRVAHTTVHVHGGVGIDLDGEAHRYFTAAKRLEFAFGGATEQALQVGRSFAD